MATLVGRLPFSQACFPPSPPTTDHATFIGLSDNEIRAMCMSRAEEYHMFALALLSIYNSIAPIHRLPPEILSKIFEGCWMDRKSLRIGHVCRQWRSVLLSTPAFWVNAVDSETFSPDELTITYLGVILERSTPRMVDLSFSYFEEPISYCLPTYAERIVSLEVSLADESHLCALFASLKTNMPHLGTLTIIGDNIDDSLHHSWTQNLPLGPLSPHILPKLTRLTAPAFLFPILAVPSLCHVTLKARHKYHRLVGTSEGFCKALEICSHNLRSLLLDMVAYWAIMSIPQRTISLPSLCYLQVTDAIRGCLFILSHISLPKTAHVHCTAVNSRSLLRTIISANPDHFYSSLCAADRMQIRSTPAAVSVHCYTGDEERLCLGLVESTVTERLRRDDIVEIFRDRAGGVRELVLSGLGFRDLQGVDFRAFPNIVRLVICGETARNVLRQLAPNADDNAAQFQVPIPSPGLETLTVDFQLTGSGSSISGALRNKDLAMVEADLHDRCVVLERVLSYRAQRGPGKLKRLEFGYTDKSEWVYSSGRGPECILDPAGPDWVSWRPIVEPLEKLVDGPVVFTGYRFFPG